MEYFIVFVVLWMGFWFRKIFILNNPFRDKKIKVINYNLNMSHYKNYLLAGDKTILDNKCVLDSKWFGLGMSSAGADCEYITVYSVGALIDQLEEANECFRKNFFIKIATSKIPLEYPNLSLNTADYSILELAIKYYETKEDILISNNRIKAYYKMFNSILYSAVLLRLKAINSTATDKEYKELCTFVSYFFVNLRKEYG